MSTFHLQIVTPDGQFYDGEANKVLTRTIDGDVCILARHSDYVTALGMGTCIVELDGKRRKAACTGGMLSVIKGEVRIVATTFEWADQIDVERAKVESPYHSTIAHGYLTLSLLPYMWQQIIEVNNLKMMVNYGMDEMRFGQPVITGSRVRLVATLHEIANLRGICKTSIKFDIEIEGQRKPALSGIATFLYYFQ